MKTGLSFESSASCPSEKMSGTLMALQHFVCFRLSIQKLKPDDSKWHTERLKNVTVTFNTLWLNHYILLHLVIVCFVVAVLCFRIFCTCTNKRPHVLFGWWSICNNKTTTRFMFGSTLSTVCFKSYHINVKLLFYENRQYWRDSNFHFFMS